MYGENGIPTDGFSVFETRRSMTLRRSSEALARRLSHSRQHSWSEQGRLMHDAEHGTGHGHGQGQAYNHPMSPGTHSHGNVYGLGDLTEEDEDEPRGSGGRRPPTVEKGGGVRFSQEALVDGRDGVR